MLLGHLGISALIHHYAKLEFGSLMLGGVFPDIFDKSLCQVLKVTKSGRFAAHTLLALGSSTVIIYIWRGPFSALSWAAGYLGHLLGDLGGFIPWFYPFKAYDFQPSTSHLPDLFWAVFKKTKPLEILLLFWAFYLWLQDKKA